MLNVSPKHFDFLRYNYNPSFVFYAQQSVDCCLNLSMCDLQVLYCHHCTAILNTSVY